ncbi:hypothetical protein [Burkholderia cepacia]|uniref:hypothetical protein n=1 Tax=Burkholderia cepacia TaxID=292 RepID=UPI002FE38921
MIKDTAQKQKAIRYCVAMGYVPHMEVVVRHTADVAETSADISDIDVFGLKAAGEFPTRRIVFDCKTQNKISAISRALWAAGLKQLVGADEAFVILNKAAPEGHRLAASDVGVRLFSEQLFDEHGKSSSTNYLEGITYLDDASAWEEIFAIGAKFKGLESLATYLTCDGPLERNAAVGFRSLLGKVKQAGGELDVGKPGHRALYGLLVAQAILFLSAMTRDFHAVFDPAISRERFEIALRNFVWGGRDGYELRQRLHLALANARGADDQGQFQLPNWDKLVELVRGLLDAPFLAGSGALAVKDLAFRELVPQRELAERRIAIEFAANNRARQYAMQINRYLGSLSRLLRDFADHYNTVLGSVPSS